MIGWSEIFPSKRLLLLGHRSLIRNVIQAAVINNMKWDHFDILASGKSDYHCKIMENLFIQEPRLAFNVNVSSEKPMLY